MSQEITKEYLLSILNDGDLEIPNEAQAPDETFSEASSSINPPSAGGSIPSPETSTAAKQDIKNTEPTRFRDLSEFLEVVTAAPTHTPKNINDQIKYCTADSKLYLYDTINKTWKSSAAFT